MKREQIIEILNNLRRNRGSLDELSNNDIADAILALEPDLKDELIEFLKWYKNLSSSSKCTVHPPAGSGGSYGIYDLTDAALINKYLKSYERRTLP
jgi:hypothetical protein